MSLYRLLPEGSPSRIRDPDIWPLFDPCTVIHFFRLQIRIPCQFWIRNICISHVLGLKLTIWPLDDLDMTFNDPRIHIFSLSAKSAFIWYAYHIGYNVFCCISCFSTSWSLNPVISRIHGRQVLPTSKIDSTGSNYPRWLLVAPKKDGFKSRFSRETLWQELVMCAGSPNRAILYSRRYSMKFSEMDLH